MASKLIPTSVFLLVLFFLLLMRESSGLNSSYACFDANGGTLKLSHNRKMLSSLEVKKAMLKVNVEGPSTRMKKSEKEVIGELRKVPTGPDPLHHHSIGNPIKPETP
ncbi:protein CLAVATA 3 [Lathyrus oleraceus]|nr:protein CLAVATA 3-like [Pisum sativum]